MIHKPTAGKMWGPSIVWNDGTYYLFSELLGGQGMWMASSEDGVHWSQTNGETMVPNALSNHFDSLNVMFWSEAEGCYLLYARHSERGSWQRAYRPLHIRPLFPSTGDGMSKLLFSTHSPMGSLRPALSRSTL